MSTFWLSADPKYFQDIVDFSLPNDLVIPVVTIQTGSSRASISPGVYRESRVRTYADKFGTPTTLTDLKEITFSAIMYGTSMDEIYSKWQQINSYLDRAQIASSPFPRGSGVVLAEQINDANDITIWDVVSGVLTDADFNLPDTDIFAAIVQLAVLPYSRGRIKVVGLGSTLTNGTNAGFYVPRPGGDAPGLFELRLKDMSANGHYITWVAIGRRWYPVMASGDFTPWYAQSASITTSSLIQQLITTQVSAGGKHDTGLFGVYAIVNDASPVLNAPKSISLLQQNSVGTIANGYAEMVFVPRDVIGAIGNISSRQLISINNSNQPGDVQDYEGYEDGTWNSWQSLPAFVIPGTGTASLSIDATAAIIGRLGAHFKVTGDNTASSVTSASATRFTPALGSLGLQSIAYQVNPVSWGSWSSTTPVTAPSQPTVNVAGSTTLAAPSAPTISSTAAYYFGAGTYDFAYTWHSNTGETTLGAITTVTFGSPVQPSFTIPSFPANAVLATLYAGPTGTTLYAGGSVGFAGTYGFTYASPASNPPATNTATVPANFSSSITYDAGITWVTATGETVISTLRTFSNASAFNANIVIPAFPASVIAARIYVSKASSGTTVYLSSTVTAPGTWAIMQGDGVHTPPVSNTSGTGSHDATARFTWGSLTIVPAGNQNYFAAIVNSVQIGPAFPLVTGTVHNIGVNFRLVGTHAIYSIIVDGNLIGSYGNAISPLTIPVQATWAAIGAGTGGPFTEEYYLDEIYVYNDLLPINYATIGSAITANFTPDTNAITTDLYYLIHTTGQIAGDQWYQITGIVSPYTLSAPVIQASVPVTGPPSGVPAASYAQLQAKVGVGAAPSRFLAKSVVRTKIANGVDELVRLGSIELPPGSKGEERDLDVWTMQVWGMSGGTTNSLLTVKGIVLFPEDEDGWCAITAKAYGLNTAGTIWHIGTNRYGRPYGQIFASDGVTLLGYADTTGAIGSMPGDNEFVILTGRDDGKGNLIMDLAQQFQLGYQVTPRNHFEVTSIPVV